MTSGILSSQLGDLSDPAAFTSPLELAGCDPVRLRVLLRTMLLIRRAEEIVGDGVASREIICPAHLAIGQEAVPTGISEHLRHSDRIFGAHRSHGHYLALGGSLYKLLAEVLGRDDGCAKGMGGSMHLVDNEHGLKGTVPIVAGTVPLAVGAALAARKDGNGDIAVAYFGDGAAEEGVIHESLNLAAVWKLPVLFVCENNLFSSHLHISLRQPADRVARFAEAHMVPAETVDGNDVLAVSEAASRLVARCRAGDGPGFLETITYRWRGHVGHREDEDVGVNRGSDLQRWKARDPVQRLYLALEKIGEMSADAFAGLCAEIADEVAATWRRAQEAPFPSASRLLDLVYAEGGK